VPFGDALAPTIDRACSTLTARDSSAVLTTDAVRGLAAGLADDLARLTTTTLVERFLATPGRAWLDPDESTAYRAFEQDLADGGFVRLLAELPELGRLVDHTVTDWQLRAELLLTAVIEDAPLLSATFGVQPPFFDARLLGDRGTSLTDAHGTRVLFKARRLGMDHAFSELLRWFDEQSPSLPLFVPTICDRGRHGWAQYVPDAPPATRSERCDHFRRVGSLACITHVLGGGDMHEGNVRGFGPHPVVIDGEKLLRPAVPAQEPGASALTTGWFPIPILGPRCGLAAELWRERPRRWLHVGSDAVRQLPQRALAAAYRPRAVEHFAVHGEEMIEHVTAGFREAYRLIAERGLPLDLFATCAPRVIVRNSLHYQEAIEASLRPEALACLDRRRAIFDDLTSVGVPALVDDPDTATAVRGAERRALDALVLPRFWAPAASRGLWCEDILLGEPFCESALDRAHRLVGEMSPAEADLQCREIAESIADAPRHMAHQSISITLEPHLHAMLA